MAAGFRTGLVGIAVIGRRAPRNRPLAWKKPLPAWKRCPFDDEAKRRQRSASQYAGQVRLVKAADIGTESMNRNMDGAIQDIQKSADETAKIIKRDR